MKKIYNSFVLQTKDYCIVDLEKEYSDYAGENRYVVVTEYEKEDFIMKFKDEVKKYEPYIVTGMWYFDFIQEEYARARSKAYADSVYITPYVVDDNTDSDFAIDMTLDFEARMKENETLEEEYENIRKALLRIKDEKMRSRLVKYFWYNKTQEEIAHEEGIQQSSVCRGINAGIKKIKKFYKNMHN